MMIDGVILETVEVKHLVLRVFFFFFGQYICMNKLHSCRSPKQVTDFGKAWLLHNESHGMPCVIRQFYRSSV